MAISDEGNVTTAIAAAAAADTITANTATITTNILAKFNLGPGKTTVCQQDFFFHLTLTVCAVDNF